MKRGTGATPDVSGQAVLVWHFLDRGPRDMPCVSVAISKFEGVSLKRVLLGTGLAVAVAAAGWLLFSRRDSHDVLRSRYLQGDLSGTIAAIERAGEVEVPQLLLAANCYRQLGRHAAFQATIEQAQSHGGQAAVKLPLALYNIHYGKLRDPPQRLVKDLIAAGATASEACSVVLESLLAENRFSEAESVLLDGERSDPDSPQLAHLRAVYLNLTGDSAAAEEQLLNTISRHPEYELAWLALSQLYSRPPNVRLRRSEFVLSQSVKNFPHNSGARLQLAQFRRRLGDTESARAGLVDRGLSMPEVVELAEVEADLGNHVRAVELLAQIGLQDAAAFQQMADDAFRLMLNGRAAEADEVVRRVSWAATIFALSQNHKEASRVFDVAIDRAKPNQTVGGPPCQTTVFTSRATSGR